MATYIVKEMNLGCDLCDRQSDVIVPLPHNANKRYLRRYMKGNNGWAWKKIDGEMKDVCPKCKKDL